MRIRVLCILIFIISVAIGSLFHFFSLSLRDRSLGARKIFKSGRDPAAIQKKFDFSELEGSALTFASKRRLLEEFKIVRNEDKIGLEFGHFVVKGSRGEKTFACQEYSHIHLIFEADGFALNGERSKMEVEAPCEMAEDINKIVPIWIPIAQIKAMKPADGELSLNEGRPLLFKYSNLGEQWPKAWILTSVSLYKNRPTDRDHMSLGLDEIREINGTLPTLEW